MIGKNEGIAILKRVGGIKTGIEIIDAAKTMIVIAMTGGGQAHRGETEAILDDEDMMMTMVTVRVIGTIETGIVIASVVATAMVIAAVSETKTEKGAADIEMMTGTAPGTRPIHRADMVVIGIVTWTEIVIAVLA
jgi:hypothetical protein